MPSNTQSNILYSNEIFRQYLLTLSNGLVWKNMTLANSSENQDSMYLSELFVNANRGLLSFDIIKAFPRVILKNSGVPENLIGVYAADKTKIPLNNRNDLVREYTRALCSKNPLTGYYEYFDTEAGVYVTVYQEKNNYYRMLMGLPDIGDTSFIYNTNPRWSTTIPIHQLPLVDRIEMDTEGILDALYKAHPTKDYLKYCGLKNIDFFTARIAGRFEILYRASTDSDVLNSAFDTEYGRSRLVVNNVYYSSAYKKTNALYENFLAMCILFMTLQAMNYRYLQTDITRDFYDTESIKLVYDSYKVPFYTEIPLEYHRKIIKNINRLISYKGSSQVFFDLFDIFDMSAMDIYSYFLTKTHKLDGSGNPLFIPKLDEHGNEMYDAEGHLLLDPSNYDIKFSKVKIYNDPALASADSANDIEYSTLTENDPYWIDDAELQEKLRNESFNYTESKYIGIQTVFNLMNITFENAYIFRMISDNKELTKNMTVHWVDVGINSSIFSMFMYMAALYCRYYGYEGSITDHIPALMETFGYNFQDSAQVLSTLRTDPILSRNTQLINLISSLNVTNVDSLNINYATIKSLRDLIASGYLNSSDKKEYDAYRNLYKALMISREIEAVYTDPDTGEIFDSFVDVLNSEAPDLMQRYLLLNDSEVMDELSLVIDQIELTISHLSHLQLSAGISSSSMINSLFKVLTFFKSAKCDLIGYNVSYVINSRSNNFFKMLDCVQLCHDESSTFNESQMQDLLSMVYDFLRYRLEVQSYVDQTMDSTTSVRLREEMKYLRDHVARVSSILQKYLKDNTRFIDVTENLVEQVRMNSLMLLNDMSDTELLGFVLHEHRYTGTIKERIQTLVDSFYVVEIPNMPTIYELSEIGLYIDLLHSFIIEARQKNDRFKSELESSDTLSINDTSNKTDIAEFQDVIKQLYLTITQYSSELIEEDKLYQEYVETITKLKSFNTHQDLLISSSYGSETLGILVDSIHSLGDALFGQHSSTDIMDALMLSDSIHLILNYLKGKDLLSIRDFILSLHANNSGSELTVFHDNLYEVDNGGSMIVVE